MPKHGPPKTQKPTDTREQEFQKAISNIEATIRECSASSNKTPDEINERLNNAKKTCIDEIKKRIEELRDYFGAKRSDMQPIDLERLRYFWDKYRDICKKNSIETDSSLEEKLIVVIRSAIEHLLFEKNKATYSLAAEFGLPRIGEPYFETYCNTLLENTDEEKSADNHELTITYSDEDKTQLRWAIINKKAFLELVKNRCNERPDFNESLTSALKIFLDSEPNKNTQNVSKTALLTLKILGCSRSNSLPTWEFARCASLEKLATTLQSQPTQGLLGSIVRNFVSSSPFWNSTPPPSSDSSPAASAATSPPTPALSAQNGNGNSSG